MRIFWIGLASIAALIFVVIPYTANEGCKDRWAQFKAEASWDFKSGCMGKIRGVLFREENVSIGPVNRK